MSEKVAIEFDNLTKNFENTRAVKSVNLEIKEGEVFGLLGPNGAGKTTLVNMLVGLVEPTEGTASVFGNDIKKDYQEVHKKIGLAPTENNFDREFSVRENLEHHAGYFGSNRAKRKEKTKKYLKKFDLWDKKNEKPYFLSSGMRKKLLIARAMITDPEILILDEPTAALDVETRWMIHETIKQLAEEGLTIILTTHYIREAEKLCERVAIMDEGKIIAKDSPHNLIKKSKKDKLKIKLQEKPKRIPDIDESIFNQVNLENGSKLIFNVDNANESAPKIIKNLLERGYSVEELEIRESTLEDIFYELT